jgi:hypothetical protein
LQSLTFHSGRAFQTLETVPTPLLVSPWLAAGSITLLFGPPSAGKTHTTLALANALSRGEALWGVYPTVASRVLIVQADMNTALYQDRIRANDVVAHENVAVLLTDAMPINVLALSGREPGLVEARGFAPDVVFVDTLRKTHDGDENDSAVADRVYGAWRRLFPGAALVFLHHSRKLPTAADANRVIQEAFRGSAAWAASADTLVAVRRVRRANNPNWMLRLQFVRTRSCEEPAPILLTLTPDLMLTPVATTATERALMAHLVVNPRLKRAEAVKWLLEQKRDGSDEPMCSQATAYRVWDRVVRGVENP